MSSIEIISKIETLKEYEAIAAEAAAMIESIKDEIKRHMDTQGVDELTVGTHIIRYTTVLSNRFDSTAFKKVMPSLCSFQFAQVIVHYRTIYIYQYT